MKYKTGDEVSIEFVIKEVLEKDGVYRIAPKMESAIGDFFIEKDLVKEPDITDEELWEIMKKIYLLPSHDGFNSEEMDEIFGTKTICKVLEENTMQEAKEKIEAWKENKKLHVGDIVECICDGTRGMVTKFYKNKKVIEVFTEYATIDILNTEEVVKTGKTAADEYEKLKKQIRGE